MNEATTHDQEENLISEVQHQHKYVIQLENVSKIYVRGLSKKTVLENINLSIKAGEFVHLKGANGAGKTTLVNLILGLQVPSRGEVKLFGQLPTNSSAKRSVGVMLQSSGVPDKMQVKEGINLFRSYYGNPLELDEILKISDLQGKEEFAISQLSGGLKQRFFFALAIAGRPSLLILDEPTRNLDRDGYSKFWEQIKELYQDHKISILFITNIQSDQEKIAEVTDGDFRVIEIEEGNIKTDTYIKTTETTTTMALRSAQEVSDSKMLFEQIKVELTALKRNSFFWLPILLLSLTSLLISNQDQNTLKLTFAGLGGFNLITIALEKLSIGVAVERASNWSKLLRTTPLPAKNYFAAKIFVYVTLALLSLSILLICGSLKNDLPFPDLWSLSLLIVLVLGSTPFVLMGLGLGLWLGPKSLSSVSALILVAGIFTCGFPLVGFPEFVQDIVAYSPFYHYGQVAIWAIQSNVHVDYVWLHFAWLIWAFITFWALASWLYHRDQVEQ